MIYLSQINQAMTYKSVSDICRVHSSVEMIDPRTSQGYEVFTFSFLLPGYVFAIFSNTMGLLYWQLNEIWQAPSKASIEYDLKWKMTHYYVQHMYEPIYPITILEPYLANITDPNATISIYVVSELVDGIRGHLYCSIQTLETFTPRFTFSYQVRLNSSGTQHIAKMPFQNLMRDFECTSSNSCLLHCSYNDSQHEIGQTLFLTRPKYYQLYQPNIRISNIQQISTNDIELTLNATRPALFVWLDMPKNTSGYYSENGFHMFKSSRTIMFHSWTTITNLNSMNFDLHLTSLYDVTQS